ncbi:hypothetical protein [Actinomadura rugatobispora]|uniref:Uncharacterized protein n=1 Tax=Actinomadura rugatobispora TaxID=1994 RepID=A0ABW1AC00_9ACTN|nr:hypothetical protein GCM10010200_079290 [Actinomadura rugatobispora]
MSTPTGDEDLEIELEVDVEAELTLAESSRPEEATGPPVSEWLFDPADVQRQEIELRNLLDAVEELYGGSRPDQGGAAEGA